MWFSKTHKMSFKIVIKKLMKHTVISTERRKSSYKFKVYIRNTTTYELNTSFC